MKRTRSFLTASTAWTHTYARVHRYRDAVDDSGSILVGTANAT